MSPDANPPGQTRPRGCDSDYDSILATLMETVRGRSFLNEYLRRNRRTDTATLLAAIERIEMILRSQSKETALAPPKVQETQPQFIAGAEPRRDPFADIRALSEAEQIALFT